MRFVMWNQRRLMDNYVVVKVITDTKERFLNLCRHREITPWNITSQEDGFIANFSKTDFMQLRDIVRKTNSKVRVIKKKGIGFILFKYRKHYSFFAGILISIGILYTLGLFVWNISFEGNISYTSSFLLKYLNDKGIIVGTRIDNINCEEIEHMIRSDYADITWVAAKITGTSLVISIKENDGAIQAVDNYSEAVNNNISEARDIIATENGIIHSIITRNGTPKVAVGDEVSSGQVLVSGMVEVYDDFGSVASTYNVKADADIYIDTTVNYYDELVLKHDIKNYTGRKQQDYYIDFPDYEIFMGLHFGKYEEYDTIMEVYPVVIGGSFFLPIRVGKKTTREYKTETTVYTQEEATQILEEKFNTYINELKQNDVQIIDNNVQITPNEELYKCEGSVHVTMPAYQYSEVTMPENTQNSNKAEN